MKKIRLILICTAFSALCTQSCAQNSAEFEAFVDIFPQRDYPFNLAYENGTEFEIPLPSIPEELYKKYVFQDNYYVVNKGEEICFSGLYATGKFPAHKLYQLFLISKDSDVSGCGEEDHLITYSWKGKIIDTLFVFGRSTYYGEKNEKEHISFAQEALITSDSIVIKRIEKIGKSVKEGDRYKDKIKVYDKIYHISKEGKFIKDEEAWKDDVRYWGN